MIQEEDIVCYGSIEIYPCELSMSPGSLEVDYSMVSELVGEDRIIQAPFAGYRQLVFCQAGKTLAFMFYVNFREDGACNKTFFICLNKDASYIQLNRIYELAKVTSDCAIADGYDVKVFRGESGDRYGSLYPDSSEEVFSFSRWVFLEDSLPFKVADYVNLCRRIYDAVSPQVVSSMATAFCSLFREPAINKLLRQLEYPLMDKNASSLIEMCRENSNVIPANLLSELEQFLPAISIQVHTANA